MKVQTALQSFILVALSLVMVACGKTSSKNSGSTRVNRYQNQNLTTVANACGSTAWTGRIYDESTDSNTFRQRVAEFSFRNLDEIGSISNLYNANTGIEFQMNLAFAGGQLQSAKASFKISDSYTVQENAGYIHFVMESNLGGTIYNTDFEARIGDPKGSVRFIGRRNGQAIYGKVYYNNNNTGDKILGDFAIQGCAVTGN